MDRTHYLEYCWKEGVPYGIQPISAEAPLSYVITADPYRKRITLEKHLAGTFSELLYDSALIDFRHLKEEHQIGWEKKIVEEASSTVTGHIRNQDDRLILIEKYTFEQGKCLESRAYSPHGILLFIQKMENENGIEKIVVLDPNHRVVLKVERP